MQVAAFFVPAPVAPGGGPCAFVALMVRPGLPRCYSSRRPLPLVRVRQGHVLSLSLFLSPSQCESLQLLVRQKATQPTETKTTPPQSAGTIAENGPRSLRGGFHV